jgi:hypothetical protein
MAGSTGSATNKDYLYVSSKKKNGQNSKHQIYGFPMIPHVITSVLLKYILLICLEATLAESLFFSLFMSHFSWSNPILAAQICPVTV